MAIMPAIFKNSCSPTTNQPHSYEGGIVEHFMLFFFCTFPSRVLVDWSVSSIYWVEGSETQSQTIIEPTQKGS